MTTTCISRGHHAWSAHPLHSFTMLAMCVTVMEGARVVVSGGAVQVDESAMLSSILALVLEDQYPADIRCVNCVQLSSSDADTRLDASLEEDVALQLEFERMKN